MRILTLLHRVRGIPRATLRVRASYAALDTRNHSPFQRSSAREIWIRRLLLQFQIASIPQPLLIQALWFLAPQTPRAGGPGDDARGRPGGCAAMGERRQSRHTDADQAGRDFGGGPEEDEGAVVGQVRAVARTQSDDETDDAEYRRCEADGENGDDAHLPMRIHVQRPYRFDGDQ